MYNTVGAPGVFYPLTSIGKTQLIYYLYTLDCKNVDTQQAFIMNDETQQRAIQTFPEENVLS